VLSEHFSNGTRHVSMSPRKVDNWKILSDEGERLSNVLMPENDSENKKEKPKHRNKNLILLANCKLVAPEMMTILFLVKIKTRFTVARYFTSYSKYLHFVTMMLCLDILVYSNPDLVGVLFYVYRNK
jgi:hypothetical protein